MTTSPTKRLAVIVERDGEVLARDFLDGCEAVEGDAALVADIRLKLMQLVRLHEIDIFDEPVHCRVEALCE